MITTANPKPAKTNQKTRKILKPYYSYTNTALPSCSSCWSKPHPSTDLHACTQAGQAQILAGGYTAVTDSNPLEVAVKMIRIDVEIFTFSSSSSSSS
jgi:hypothetical protein